MARPFLVLSRKPRPEANADRPGIEIQRHGREDCPLGIEILHEHAKAIVDIVFVHGLTGDRERTWHSVPDRRHPNGVLWPKELLPDSIPESRILTFGYDACIFRSGRVPNNRIRDHARDLVNELASVRVSVEERMRPIIFVVHSLGGIVCKDALQISTLTAEPQLQSIALLTRAILFVATPHEGSAIAQWASIPASTLGVITPTNVDLLAVLQTSSEVRDRIQDDFMSLLQRRQSEGPPLDVTCLFETMKTSKFTIVPRRSAVLPGYNSISVPANHQDIVRFSDKWDHGFKTILAELRRWIDHFAMEYGEVEGIDPRIVRRCVESLRFPELHNRQAAIERAAEETCTWILADHRYQAWIARQELDRSRGLLWIKGKPGSGKSTLMKFLCERASPLPKSIRLTYYFNARGTELERTPLGLYRSLMLQLVVNKHSRPAMKPFLTQLDEKEEIFGQGKYAWRLTEVQDAFHDTVTSGGLPPLELFVDALDECDEGQVRHFVRRVSLSAAKAVAKGLAVNVCWSSRHYPHISTKCSFEIHLENQNSSDIRSFVHQELSACTTLGDHSNFEQYIVNEARGVFLWATLVVQRLVKAADDGASNRILSELLRRLPTELDKLLHEILYSIEATFHSDTLHLIQWTLFATRPLLLEEVRLALAFSTGSAAPSSLEDFSGSLHINKDLLDKGETRKLDMIDRARSHSTLGRQNEASTKDEIRTLYIERDRRYVTAVSGGLVEVIRKPSGVQYLQVIHESVRDFLLRQVVRVHLGLELSSNFKAASHSVMFEACRRFILCPEFRYCLRPSFSQAIFNNTPLEIDWGWLWTRHPFTQYAVQYIIDHAEGGLVFHQNLDTEQIVELKKLYRRWLTVSENIDNKNMSVTDTKCLKQQLPRFNDFLLDLGVSLSMSDIAKEWYCHKNLHWIYKELLNDPVHRAAMTCRYQSLQSFERDMKLLLEMESNGEYRKFLTHSILHNDNRVSPQFNFWELACFTQILKQCTSTPFLDVIQTAPVLFWAVKLDRPDIINDLLDCGFVINDTDDKGRTPLRLSVELGHPQCTSLLFSRDGMSTRAPHFFPLHAPGAPMLGPTPRQLLLDDFSLPQLAPGLRSYGEGLPTPSIDGWCGEDIMEVLPPSALESPT
jgi:hypothetical protein